jgi:abortive infection bacteriophage resistance protein
MEYSKPPITFEAQAELLLSRGLQADKAILISRLQAVNYYRLSAYLYPFRQQSSDAFRVNTTLDLVWSYYTLDRQLRILVMDAIERIEVAVRTQLAYHFSHRHGAFGYLDQAFFPKLGGDRYKRWIDDMKDEIDRSRETFIRHFQAKYGDCHDLPPLWMLCEVMSFGKMLTLFNGVNDDIRRLIAREYGIEDKILQSWLGALNVIRNICAHHGRLWNRELGFKPFIPQKQKYPLWHDPVAVPNNRIFAILTILKYLLIKVAPTSHWDRRFRDLLGRYPEIPLGAMGFPQYWETHAIWRSV